MRVSERVFLVMRAGIYTLFITFFRRAFYLINIYYPMSLESPLYFQLQSKIISQIIKESYGKFFPWVKKSFSFAMYITVFS